MTNNTFRACHALLRELSCRRRLSPYCIRRFYHTERPSPAQSLLPIVLSSSNLIVTDGSSRTPPLVITSRKVEGAEQQDNESVVPLFVYTPTSSGDVPVGLVRPNVFEALKEYESTCAQNGRQSPLQISQDSKESPHIAFSDSVNAGGLLSRTRHVHHLVEDWKSSSMFRDILRGWSDEMYPVYIDQRLSQKEKVVDARLAFSIERAALPLFGLPNYGCLLIAHFQSQDTGRRMFWVPRRSRTKRTWPGLLDVTVGGGMGTGESSASTIIRECAEEASLDEDFVRVNIRRAGFLPFPNRSPAGWILPGFYHLFELPLPSDGSVRPQINPADGEVEGFELMDADTIVQNLLSRQFKSSSALAFIHHLIRHKYLTEENEPEFGTLCRELNRQCYPYIYPFSVSL